LVDLSIGRHCSWIAAKLAEACLKKTEYLLNPEKSKPDSHLRVLDIDIDTASGTVWRGNEVIDLPDLSFRLLVALASKAPAMVSKDALIAEVWGDVVVSDETLMQRVRLLRQILGDDSQNPRYIASVRGRGYRLAAPVEVVSARTSGGRQRISRRWVLGAAIGLVVLAALVIFSLTVEDQAQAPAIRTLAVLPFDDLSEDKRFGFFADGMQEELLARLAGLEEVSVLSRTSVERFRGASDSIPIISRELGADAIIEGSVRVSDDRLRITVQLIDGAADQHLWAESYEEPLTVENVFAIQEKVANNIAEALRTEYQRQQTDALGLPTTDIEAYNLYLLGRYQTFRQTPENLALAAQYLEQATERDPEFAEAYAALGWAYAFQGTDYGRSDPDSVFPLAQKAALRALELDDRLADAHSLYADILTWYDWRFQLAEIEYQRAMALDPLNVLGYALFLSSQSRHDEAIELVERRLAEAPDDDYVNVNAGWNYIRAGRYEDAIDASLKVRDHPDAARLLGFGRLGNGEPAAALAAFEEDIRQQGRGQVQLGNLAYAYFKVGRASRAQALLDELEAQSDTRFVSSLTLAAIYFAKGDEVRGFELLETAVDDRERGVIFLNVNGTFAKLRTDPRFIALVERVGLPQP
jgi:TolB-like protein/DNA-binding winged helix-turn-helix (wHTH) protein/Tfp pilus assembly protein PilF